MLGKSPENAGKSPKAREAVAMSSQAEARYLVELIAGPMRLGENVKAALSRVARTTGLNDRRVRGIWHNEARSIRSEEMDRLREAARDARATEQARNEHRSVLSLLATADAALGLPGSDVDRSDDPALGFGPGDHDRPLDQGH
jgi:cell division septum initiation protein DivIVA